MSVTTVQGITTTVQAVLTNSSIYENSTSAAAKAAEVLPLTDSSASFLPLKIFSFMILFIFVLTAYFYIKKKSGTIINRKGIIKEAERFYYNPKTFISVVKIGKEVLVLSVNDTNTSLLTKIEDDESLEKIEEGAKERETPVFKDILISTQGSFEEIKKKLKKMRQEDNEV